MTSQKTRRKSLQQGNSRFAWVLLAPALTAFTFVFVVPIIYSGRLSLIGQKSSGGAYGAKIEQFVGLENYVKILKDPTFWSSLGNLGKYALLMVPLMMTTSICLALFLDQPRVKLRSMSRTFIFLPYGVPSVIAALMWGFMYVPEISPLYRGAEALGIALPQLLRGDAVFVGVTNVVLWGGIGFNTIIIYTALQSLSREIIDAAMIDGCNDFRVAWHIKLPHIIPATILTSLFSAIGALQIYSEPQMLSTLTTALHSTFFPLMRVYRDAFAHDDLYSASAASILLALLTVLLSLVILGINQLRSKARINGNR